MEKKIFWENLFLAMKWNSIIIIIIIIILFYLAISILLREKIILESLIGSIHAPWWIWFNDDGRP